MQQRVISSQGVPSRGPRRDRLGASIGITAPLRIEDHIPCENDWATREPASAKPTARQALALPKQPARETFHLLLITTTILCSYGHNGARRVRFQNRRQHHLFETRCLYQLDAQKLTLADAHGPRLLRHRAHGGSVRPLRYLQIRRRGHEVFAPAIRCHDCRRDCHL